MLKIVKYKAREYGDKNNNIQISTDSETIYLQAKGLFYGLKTNFPELNFFLQGDSNHRGEYWLMFESWSDNYEMFEKAFESFREWLILE